ncbi:MAG: DNA cytosine methyltransferase [Candidatus Nomurabacteria bacterium]|jgi:DNA (cytosine-5)-methyltransferase 1|nr:DNA cytosine methyltransferase [Candidatus Nomurabacteria bacterium]
MGSVQVFSCFSGIGGFEHGIINASKTTNTEVEIIGHSEIDKFAESVYMRHYPESKNYGDITKISTDNIPDFTILVGGFPCQTFSSIGKRAGFADPRGKLFLELARILKAKRPRLFVFENVKGLLSQSDGQAFASIVSMFAELGYDCEWSVLNSVNFATPQTRERVIIVGSLREQPIGQIFSTDWTQETRTVLESDVIVSYSRTRDKAVRKNTVNTITASYRGVGGYNEPAVLCDKRIRRLTPLECEKLQCFPDNWTQYGNNGKPISDSQRYKMCGNAVCTTMIQAVFEKIFLYLQLEKGLGESPRSVHLG